MNNLARKGLIHNTGRFSMKYQDIDGFTLLHAKKNNSISMA